MDRILIIHRGALGDFLLLVPSLKMLKGSFPGSQLTVAGRPDITGVVSPGLVDAAVSAEASAFLPVFENVGHIPPPATAFFARFDGVLALVRDPEHVLERNLAKLGIKHILVRSPFPPENVRIHAAQYLYENAVSFLEQDASLLDLSEFRQDDFGDVFDFSEKEVRQAMLFLRRTGLPERDFIAIHPGSGSRSKCWPIERFERLAERLMKNGRRILWILGPADRRLLDRLNAPASDRVFADSLPLRQLAIIFSRSAAYIGNDSGVSHLAALAGIPTTALFGPTDPAVWAPLGKSVTVLRGSAGCSPCTREEMRDCEHRDCLETITLEAVEQAVEKAPKR